MEKNLIRFNSKEESYQVKNMLQDLNIETFLIKPKKNKFIKKNMADARTNRFEGIINFCNKNDILHLIVKKGTSAAVINLKKTLKYKYIYAEKNVEERFKPF